MRDAFFQTLYGLASNDDRVTLMVGDLGFGVVERFAAQFPLQFVNAGVAEQNMAGVATGLALSGKLVFIYSIGNFATIRCLEQIRNDICYHRANVKIVTVGGGLAYGSLGATHHATEDLAIMRALPEMTVVAPGDPLEAVEATVAITRDPGPCYLRLGRAGEARVHTSPIEFTLGKALVVREGTDVTIISAGGVLSLVAEAAQVLTSRGISARVLSMHTLKPLDEDAVVKAARETRAIIAVEEHSRFGGLGGAVAEVLAESDVANVGFRRIALPSAFCTQAGSQHHLRTSWGLSAPAIVLAAEQMLKRAGRCFS